MHIQTLPTSGTKTHVTEMQRHETTVVFKQMKQTTSLRNLL